MTRDELSAKIGANVRAAREAKGWTQQRLADECGMQKPNVSRLESGRGEAKVWTLWLVATALGVQIASLMPQAE